MQHGPILGRVECSPPNIASVALQARALGQRTSSPIVSSVTRFFESRGTGHRPTRQRGTRSASEANSSRRCTSRRVRWWSASVFHSGVSLILMPPPGCCRRAGPLRGLTRPWRETCVTGRWNLCSSRPGRSWCSQRDTRAGSVDTRSRRTRRWPWPLDARTGSGSPTVPFARTPAAVSFCTRRRAWPGPFSAPPSEGPAGSGYHPSRASGSHGVRREVFDRCRRHDQPELGGAGGHALTDELHELVAVERLIRHTR